MEQTDRTPAGLGGVRSVARACFTALAIGLGAWVLYATRGAIAAVIASALVATALLHASDALVRRGWSRQIANGVVLTAFLGAIGLVAGLLLPRLFAQLADLVARGPDMLRDLRDSAFVQTLAKRYHLALAMPVQTTQRVEDVAAPALSVLGNVAEVALRLVMVVFLTVFMVLFGRDVVRAAMLVAVPEHRARYQRVAGALYRRVGGYLGGLALVCSVNATLTSVFLTLTGLPFALPLGILSGFSSLVPYAGPFVVHTSLTVFAFASGGPWLGLATLAYFLVYDNLEGNVFGPLVFERTVHVNPLVSLVAILVLGEFAGIVGALVAVPVAAAGELLLREFVAERGHAAAEAHAQHGRSERA